MMNEKYDVVIIGSGPAGLTAAIYAQRAKLNTLVIEKSYMSGGQIINTYEVDNYPGLQGINGFDMGIKFREHAEKLGAVFLQAEVLGLEVRDTYKVIKTEKGDLETICVLIATGASHRKLAISGELEYVGKGVSYCATCDGAFFRDKTVVVVGGGDVAVEEAIFLSRLCKRVYVVHRRDTFRAAKMLQEKLFSLDNIEVIWDSVVKEIKGGEQVQQIVIENDRNGTIKEILTDGVFVAIGIIPNTKEFMGVVKMNEANYIIAGEDGCTNIAGIFVAGDVRTKMLRQIVTAVADGANAIASIQEYLIEC